MKANQKFQQQDEAVSPVIAVILMVAITVVLAATVYVWVSGFGQSGSQAKTLAAAVSSTSGNVATITVSSVSPNFNWDKLKVVVDGSTQYGIFAFDKYTRDGAWTTTTSGTAIAAGDTLKVAHRDAGNAITVKFVDTASNTVVSQITVNVGQDSTVPTVTSCTKADPSVLTFAEAMYTTSTWSAPDDLFTWNEVSGDADSLGATALSYSLGFTTINVDMAGATPTPDNTDQMQPDATNKAYDLAGNVWAAACVYS